MKPHVLLLLALSGCSHVFGIQGSGVEATQTRTVETFERLDLAGSAGAIVRVGEDQSVTVFCDDNLIDHVRVRVVDGTLELGMEKGSYSFRKGLRFEVSVPRLTGVALAGSGDVDVSGIDAEAFDIDIAGSGEVRAAGRAERVRVDIAGSGDAELFSLAVRSADASIAGSGKVDVSAAEDLRARIMGSGSVRYRGEPRVTRSIAGSGEVLKHR